MQVGTPDAVTDALCRLILPWAHLRAAFCTEAERGLKAEARSAWGVEWLERHQNSNVAIQQARPAATKLIRPLGTPQAASTKNTNAKTNSK